ncbi:flagellar hook-associated protein FlgK [bacterium]|nr:flagellar hook-associated protein FlgK [bacterium]
MTLFSALYVGQTGVNVSQLALTLTGNNITNASTDGYTRQSLNVSTSATVRYGSLNLGTGVSTISTTQQINRYLNERARQALGTQSASDTQASLFQQVEGIFNELSDGDVSSQLDSFFKSIQDVANNPTDLSLRGIAVQQGESLTGLINNLRTQLNGVGTDITAQIKASANQINGIVTSVNDLNNKIVSAEAGNSSDAGDLRDQRNKQLNDLSKLIDIQVYDQPNGSVNILTGGDYLLFDNSIQKVGALDLTDENGTLATKLAFVNSQRVLSTDGGALGGMQDFRDNTLQGVIGKLDSLSSTLIQQFNRIYSSGQGLQQFTSVTSTNRVIDPTATLSSATTGLSFAPTNGSFQLVMANSSTGQKNTYTINVDLNGVGADDNLNDLINRINTTVGSTVASVDAQGRVSLTAPQGSKFSFANDTSGILTSLGINTFFTGKDSVDIGVNSVVARNPSLFAASSTGASGDNQTALTLGDLQTKALSALNGQSIGDYMTGIVEVLGSGSSAAQMQKTAANNAYSALQSQNLAVSGVSLDEETVNLMTYQRAFQASARYIQTINQLLDEVINLGK